MIRYSRRLPWHVWCTQDTCRSSVPRGVRVGRKRVARLMRSVALAGVSRRKRPHTTVRSRGTAKAPDLVQRQFTAEAPDRLWVADITYVPTGAGFLYLAVVVACSGDAWLAGPWSLTSVLNWGPQHGPIPATATEVSSTTPIGDTIHSLRLRQAVQ